MITAPSADPAGDDLIAGAESHAAALICATRDRDRRTAAEILAPLDRRQLYALVVLLAAAYPDDRTLPDLLAASEERDAAALREMHAAWKRGIRTLPVAEGERAYQRHKARRHQRRAHA